MNPAGSKPDPNHEKVKSALRLGTHLLVIVSAVSLLYTQKLWISSTILLGTSLFTLFFVRHPRGGSWWELASFLYLVYFFADWFWVTRSLAPSLVHLFIFIIINKLFNLQTHRDYYQLYLLTFLSMLAATALSIEIEMLYMILLFSFLFVWNLLSITLIKMWLRSDPTEAFPFSLFHPRYWGFIAVATTGMILFALGIFFILPRAQLGYFAGLNPDRVQHVSGFSKKVELGDIAAIQENTGEVMRVRVTGQRIPVGHRFYWRGAAFDKYDGKSWSTSRQGTSFLSQDSSSSFVVSAADNNPAFFVKQEIYLTPIDSGIIFGQHRIAKIEGNFFSVSRDANGTLIGMGRPNHYDVYSQINIFPPERLKTRQVSYSENALRYYTRLPALNPEIENLAKQITAGGNTIYDRVALVQSYLEKNYQYTTTDLPRSDTDPIYHFLFKKKMGHCEYFATAMVVLLRNVQVPSRLVNGFLEGEYNEIGEFYTVRQSDAHSWVEVYFGNGLWIQFDPSPRSVAAFPEGRSIWEIINPRKVFDSISFFWDRYILIFSAQDQLNVLSSVRERSKKLNDTLREKSSTATSPQATWRLMWKQNRFLLVAIGLLPFLIYYAIRFYKARKRKLELIRSPVLFYQEMLTLLQQKGFVKPVAATPFEFAEQVTPVLPAPSNEDVASLTNLFYKARFGNYSLTPDDQAFVESALSRLQRNK
jgi:transglutaminase-like putative cysteine protease